MSRSRSLFHRGTLAIVIGGLSSTACYEAKPLHLTVQTAATTLDCVRTVDRVFFDASYVRMSNVLGPNVFYTPRVGPSRQTTWRRESSLGWGIGVWLTEPGSQRDDGTCGFALEGLSPDPGCSGPTCRYSAQRGADVDQALRDMTRRLAAAFE
jgi:hypothetical protein